MAFKKMSKPRFPPRHWSIVGYPGSGKSTFAARMRGPSLIVDADHRFSEVMDLADDEVYELSEDPADNVDPDAINRILNKNMPGSGVRTIIVDSLTSIITPLVVQAMIDRDRKRSRNLMAGFQKKALAMRQLQDAITRWGTDTLWIYHLQQSRDAKANSVIRSTVSQTEIARLTRSINVQLQIQQDTDTGKRAIRVLWARRGRSGVVLTDESGSWKEMPERLEEAIYGGLSQAERDIIESETPQVFPNAETAIAWGFESGCFETIEAARRTYTLLKEELNPRNAHEMASFWVTEIRTRQAEPTPSTPQ